MKAAVVGFSFFAGLAICEFIGIIPSFILSAAGIIVGAVLGVMKIGVPKPRTRTLNKNAPVLAVMAFAVGTGALVFCVYDVNIRRPAFDLAGQTVSGTGVVVDVAELSYDTAAYTVKAEINGVSLKLLLTGADVLAEYGDTVEFEAELYHLRDNGIFPERSYNLSKGIYLGGDFLSSKVVSAASKTPISYIREYNSFIKNKIMTAFPNDNGGLLCAVFLGDKSAMSDELSANIKMAGAAHYTAVSGLHMTMIAHMFMLVFGLTPLKYNRRFKFILLVITVVFFAMFFNLTKSVVRAGIMLVICYGGELVMRKGSVLNSLGFALFIILIFEPYACFDAGLLLSFLGTFGVGVVAPAIMKSLKPSAKPRFYGQRNRYGAFKPRFTAERYIRAGDLDLTYNIKSGGAGLFPVVDAFFTSLCAALCVLPACAVYFGGISALSPVTSVILLPFFTVAAGSAALFAVFAWWGGIGNIFLVLAGVMSKAMNGVINFFGRISAAWLSLDYAFTPYWIILSIITVATVHTIYREPWKTAKSVILSICTLALMICCYNAVAYDRIYIEIYSDSTAGWIIIRHKNSELILVTTDTQKAYSAVSSYISQNSAPTLLCLLDSTNNNAASFERLLCYEYISPETKSGVYDISGKFTLGVSESETVVLIGGYSVLITRAGNDFASAANIVVAHGWVRNKREFSADKIVYVSRSIPTERDNEVNAYYEPVRIVLEY